MSHGTVVVNQLVKHILRAIVTHPEHIQVLEFQESGKTILELNVHPDDLGKAVGRGGRVANAIRSLLASIGSKEKKRYFLRVTCD